MANKFSYGTLAQGEFFTDRKEELAQIKQYLDSENHLTIISPRRYGKSSLVRKCVEEIGRPYVWLDMQYSTSKASFTTQLLKAVLAQYPMERLKHELRHFRILPTATYNAVTNDYQFGFQPSEATDTTMLEDVLGLLQKLSTPKNKLIVVLDEFQEVRNIDKNLDKQLRSIMQMQSGLNYIFLGSQEGMMLEIFERKKSPFYHFGGLMRLNKIPYDEFYQFVLERLPATPNKEELTKDILSFSSCHPYYTQQLAFEVSNQIEINRIQEDVVGEAIQATLRAHDLDYERLWETFNNTDKNTLLQLSRNEKPLTNRDVATSTTFSSLKRLIKGGVVVRTEDYALEDPFFREWLKLKQTPFRRRPVLKIS
ncbi:MAG: ATP-binding protein [Paludibacteraceae bacterium]|nr:ATP-binding protein [Paludibacteraceae bacterium]